jgi:hypothetical protein
MKRIRTPYDPPREYRSVSEYHAAQPATSHPENHPHIVAWHRRVLADYERWKKNNET